jgi:hypothetical protein
VKNPKQIHGQLWNLIGLRFQCLFRKVKIGQFGLSLMDIASLDLEVSLMRLLEDFKPTKEQRNKAWELLSEKV